MPRQHLQMALIAATTAKIQPKINQDYSFIANGLPREAEAVAVLRHFHAAMASNARKIDHRNTQRRYPYHQMDPRFLECSVAV